MLLRLTLTTWCLFGMAFAAWDAHDTLAPTHTVVRGLAQDDWTTGAQDRTALGVTSYYGWGMDCTDATRAAGCVDMNRDWVLPQSLCTSQLLLGNEPNSGELAGHPIAASVAASITVAIKAQCPDTQLVSTNIYMDPCSDPSWNDPTTCPIAWLSVYFAAYKQLTGHDYGTVPNPDGRTDALGVHFYCVHLTAAPGTGEAPAPCLDALRALEQMPNLPQLWVTETGMYGDSGLALWPQWLTDLSNDPRVREVFAFTNRWIDCGCTMLDLVAPDGTLTPRGQAYRDWLAVSWQAWLPSIASGTAGYP